MGKKILATVMNRRATWLSVLGALLLWLTDGNAAAALTNDFGVPADLSLRAVSLSKLLLTILAATGVSVVKPKADG
jgi:hypothetical protein